MGRPCGIISAGDRADFVFLDEELKMIIVHVFVCVKPDRIEEFKAATIENARRSRQEPGIARFQVLQQKEDPACFLLIEIYRTEADPARHKETEHYRIWRDTVADMMAQPRKSVHYDLVFPVNEP
jgi:quinol monooxygenase YgiN